MSPYTGRYRYIKDLVKLEKARPAEICQVVKAVRVINSPLLPYLPAWKQHMEGHLDEAFRSYILSGIEQGFRVGFDYTHPLHSASQNMPSALAHPKVVEDYVQGELAEGRIIGPLPVCWADEVHINRLGVIPKGQMSGK